MRGYLFAICFLFSASALTQPLTPTAIDSLAERAMKSFRVPGMAIAVIKDGQMVRLKGYGLRSLRTGLPVDENTLFGIASNSKAFTAVALGILVDEKKITWDDPVRKWIPEFKLYNPYVTDAFTIRDLLTHRSGLGLGAGDLMLFPDSNNFETRDIIYNLRFLKQVSGFRTKYDYDNNMYIVAGEVIKRVSGMSWEDFVQTRILQAIGMRHSAPAYDLLKDKSDVIDAHVEVDGTVEVVPRHVSKADRSAGGIYASIADLSKWVALFLNDGKFGPDSARIFSQGVQQEIWSPQTIIRVEDPGFYRIHFRAYGLGFNLEDVWGYKQVDHSGFLEGMVTKITMIPELNLGIIVLTNQESEEILNAVTNQIKDGYLGTAYRDWTGQLLTERMQANASDKFFTDSIWKQINQVLVHPLPMDFNPYLGQYSDPWFGEVTVSNKNGKYWFDAKRSPKLSGELLFYKPDVFVVKWTNRSIQADAFVVFHSDNKGQVNAMTMKAVSPLTDFSYDFQDLNFSKIKSTPKNN
jgi:CubicO group peptidase (beta-lactamase class C family)